MEIDDLRIAVSSKLEHSYCSPLPKEFLLNLASQINKVPLPVIPDSYGIRLPHERERLTAPNWDLEPVKERRDLLALEEQERQKQAAIDTAANMQANASTSAAVQDMDLVEQGAREDLMGGAQQEDEDEDGENEEEEAEGEGEEDEEDEDEDEDDDEMEDALQSGLQAGAEAVNTSAQEGGDNSMNGDDEEDAEGSGEASGADA
jgi:transcription initiation factor TFIID subunit 9B